jgi:hypothetical protein
VPQRVPVNLTLIYGRDTFRWIRPIKHQVSVSEEVYLRVSVCHLALQFKFLRVPRIIGIQKCDKRSLALVPADVSGMARPEVGFKAEEDPPRFGKTEKKSLHLGTRVVRTGVINHHHLLRRQCLLAHRFQSSPDRLGGIKGGDNHSDCVIATQGRSQSQLPRVFWIHTWALS